MGEDLSANLRDLLRGWAELWRYPEVLSLLVRSPEAQAGEIARALVGGIATPRQPSEVFDALLEAGEYEAARSLLDRPGFRFLSGESVAAQRAVLERRLLDARQEVHARVAALRERAGVAACQESPPAGLEEALSRRRTQAEALLDDWEEAIRHGEAIRELEFKEKLDELSNESEASPEDLAVWRESVLRCIEAKRLRAAVFLLEGGPFEPLPEEPVAAPRSPEWFWQRSPRLAMDWINNVLPAPPDFRAWRHSAEDRDAEAVARLLTAIVDRVYPPEDDGAAPAGEKAFSPGNSKPDNRPVFADREEAEEFAAAVDRLLGSDGKATPAVREKEGGFETRLPALNDSRLPRFALQGAAGVRCWLPGILSQDRPLDGPDEEVVLCFGLSNSSPSQGNLVFFDLFSLLRLFSDRRHRRANFLREIGAKLSPLKAIPADGWRIDRRQLGLPQARSYAAWLLDIVNVDIEGPELIEMIVFYSGARADLLVLLTRALLEIGEERKTAATPNRLLEAWRAPGFRDAAAVVLLGPLESESRARAVLGAALVAGLEPGGRIEADEIPLLLEDLVEGGVAEDETRALLDRLVDLGLLVRGANDRELRIPPSGIGHLLIAAIPDVEEYLRDALKDREMGEGDRNL